MEKRFALFLVLSAVILFAHLMLQSKFGPPPPPLDQAEVGREADQEAAGAKPPVAAPAQVEQQSAPAEVAPVQTAEKPALTAAKEPAAPAPAERTVPQQRVTLGSMTPDSPYRLLVTLDNQGAAVERIELTERNESGRFRYRDLEASSGYLGQLAWSDVSAGGCLVNVVGPGTPAATAQALTAGAKPGLQVGDVIVKVDGLAVRSAADAEDALRRTRPGDEVELTVTRPEHGQPVSLTFTAVLTQQPLSIIRPETNAELNQQDPLSFLLSLESIGTKAAESGNSELPHLPSLRNSNWEVQPLPAVNDQPGVEFRFRLEDDQLQQIGARGPLEIVKRYRLAHTPSEELANSKFRSYHLTLEVELRNLSEENQQITYRLDGPTGLPLEGWWYSTKIHPAWFASAGARDVIWKTSNTGFGLKGTPEIYSEAQKAHEKKLLPGIPLFADSRPQPVDFVGVDTQYFSVVMKPDETAPGTPPIFRTATAVPAGEWVEMKNKARIKTMDVCYRLVSEPQTLAPGKSLRQSYTVFAGPKLPALLDQYELGRVIEYGLFPMIAKPLSWILHVFASLPLVNFGLAIIFLTVLVRGCMVPLSRKATRNAQMMQELAPEMKKIAEKYKDDLQKRGEAQRELFAKHNHNPMGGCLLMFVQLPIFIGLYRCLSVDVALRQASLLPSLQWCLNLAGPDMLWYWKPLMPGFLADETGWLGPYLNLLPIITIVLFIVQQKMFMPPATDDQTKMQQQMMQFMMIFMGVMFFKVPSGLCVYFIASSLWGLAERKLLPPVKKPDPNAPPTPSLLQRVQQFGGERFGGVPEKKARPKRKPR